MRNLLRFVAEHKAGELKHVEGQSVVLWTCGASQVVLEVKNLPANAQDIRDAGLTPGSGRFPGEGNGYPLQDSCLENSMDRGVWQTTVLCGLKEWDMTEWLTLSLFWWHLFIKNPKDTVQYILKLSLCFFFFFLEPHIKETKNAELILMQVWKKCQMNKYDRYF